MTAALVGTGPAHERAQRIITEVKGAKSLYGIDSRSWDFLLDLVARKRISLNEKPAKWLADLEHKTFIKGTTE